MGRRHTPFCEWSVGRAVAASCRHQFSNAANPASHNTPDDVDGRAARATASVHIGELSAAGQSPAARTRHGRQVRRVSRSATPPTHRICPSLVTFHRRPLLLAVGSAGAAAGPSGATDEHFRILFAALAALRVSRIVARRPRACHRSCSVPP